jgi:hypothetical protein
MAGRASGFFDIDRPLADVPARGDDLERLACIVDFALFRRALKAAVPRNDRSKGGRALSLCGRLSGARGSR